MATLEQLTARYRQRLISVPRTAYSELAARVITEVPVDTGAARNSFTPALNGVDRSNSGGSVASIANRMQPGDSATLVSTLHYIGPLEYGWSSQAPSGFVRTNVVRWQSIVGRAVRGARGI